MIEYEPQLHSWKIRDDGNSEWGKINYRGIEASYMDCDGDATEWEVRDQHNHVKGTIFHVNGMYHTDAAIAIIENIIFHLSGDSSSQTEGE